MVLLPRPPPRGDRRRISVCATLGCNGLISWIPVVGGFKRVAFCCYLRTVCQRISDLYPDQTSWIVMDNASIHRGQAVEDVVAEFPKIQLKYNTPWSPFLNPAEQLFSTWKYWIGRYLVQAHRGGRAAVHDAIRHSVRHITPTKCAKWYGHLKNLLAAILHGHPDPEEAYRRDPSGSERPAPQSEQEEEPTVQVTDEDSITSRHQYHSALNDQYDAGLAAHGIEIDADVATAPASGAMDGDDDQRLSDDVRAIIEDHITSELYTVATAGASSSSTRGRRLSTEGMREDDVDSDAETYHSPSDAARGGSGASHSATPNTGSSSASASRTAGQPAAVEERLPANVPGHPLYRRNPRGQLRHPQPPSLP